MSGAEVIAGRFELLGPLARGNMGEVHRALDLQTGETVAVKLMWTAAPARGYRYRGGQERGPVRP